MHGNQWVLKIAVLKYYSVSKRGTTAKSNPKQATDPISLHTKFGDNSSNTFPLNERKPCVTPDIGRRTSDGEKSKNNISTPQGGGHNKTEVYMIYNDKSIVEEKSSGIRWSKGPFKTLGSWFSTDPEEMIRLNCNEKLNIIETILKVWHPRSLTLRGKIIIIKSLAIPHLLQLSSAISLSEKFLINLDRMFTNFIWSDRKHLISKNILIQPIEFGGIKMVTAKNILDTSKIMWIKRLSNNIDAAWKILAKNLMGLDIKNIFKKQMYAAIKSNIKTPFYQGMLKTWFRFLTTNIRNIKEFANEELYGNPNILIDNRPINIQYRDWRNAGIVLVGDMFDKDTSKVKSKAILENEYGITMDDMKYNQITSCLLSKISKLPKIRIDYPQNKKILEKCLVDISKVKSAEVNAYLNRSLASNSNSQDKWIEFYPFLEGIDWKNIYQLPYKILLDSYLIILQYKIMHRVFTCNLNLHKWGIKPTPDCILCGQIDNLEHYFYYCKEVNTFWIQISDWLSTLFNTSVNFAVLDILLGLINYTPKHFYLINYVILIGKYFISKCKRNGSNLLFNEYKYTLKWKLSLDKNIYLKRYKLHVFEEKFDFLFDALRHM